MYGKIHRCTVTNADLDYVGSITIDPLLLVAATIHPYTQVDVVNITNGARLQTYVIPGTAGLGEICLNGAAAHHFKKGDLAIIMAYNQMPLDILPGQISHTVLVDDENHIIEVKENKVPSLEELASGTVPSRANERFSELMQVYAKMRA